MAIALIGLAVIVAYLVTQGGLTAELTSPSGQTSTAGIYPAGSAPVGVSGAFPGGYAPGSSASTGAGNAIAAISPALASQAVTSTITAAAGGSAAIAGTGLATAIPIVGAAVGVGLAIFQSLWAAHKARLAAATSENAAMNIGVQCYDQSVSAINSAYNSGQIDVQTAIAALNKTLSMYWQYAGAHIQAGRNGCNTGAICSGLICGGDVGAVCCVGCGNLAGNNGIPSAFPAPESPAVNTPVYWGVQGTIRVLQMGGGQAYYPQVFGSKYGGANRQGYFLNWNRAASA